MHNYIQSDLPDSLLKFVNNCYDRKYFYCDECGMQLISVLDEVINGYERVVKDYYLINDQSINWYDFQGLTCKEIVVKVVIE